MAQDWEFPNWLSVDNFFHEFLHSRRRIAMGRVGVSIGAIELTRKPTETFDV
jgi:hypothetical protein